MSSDSDVESALQPEQPAEQTSEGNSFPPSNADGSDDRKMSAQDSIPTAVISTAGVGESVVSALSAPSIASATDSATAGTAASPNPPAPAPLVRTPSMRLREKLARESERQAQGTATTVSGSNISNKSHNSSTSASNSAEASPLSSSVPTTSLIRTPSERLRGKLLAESNATFSGAFSGSDAKKAAASVEMVSASASASAGSGSGSGSYQSSSVTGDAKIKAAAKNDRVELSSSSDRQPVDFGDGSNAAASSASSGPTGSNQFRKIPSIDATTSSTANLPQPGAYAVAGIGASRSTSSPPEQDVEDPLVATIPTDMENAECIDAFRVSDVGIAPALVEVVDDDFDDAVEGKGRKPFYSNWRNWLIVLLLVIVITLAALGATGNLGGTSNKPSTQDTAGVVPEASFEELISITGLAEDNQFGRWVSLGLNGKRLAVSSEEHPVAPKSGGSVTVYDLIFDASLNRTVPVQVGDTKLGLRGEESNGKLSRDGNSLVVGSLGSGGLFGTDDDMGATRVFRLGDNNKWDQIGQILYGDKVQSQAGKDVAISFNGDKIASSMPYYGSLTGGDKDGSGAVRAFQLSNDIWENHGKLLSGTTPRERFGWSVSMSDDGSRLVVGSKWQDATNPDSYPAIIPRAGQLAVYDFDPTTNDWTLVGEPIYGLGSEDIFGARTAISADGSIVAGGAYGADDSNGYVRIFEYNDKSQGWEQLGNTITGKLSGDQLAPVALSGDGKRIVVGSNEFNKDAGYVQVLDFNTQQNEWVEVGGGVIKGGSEAGCGTDVAISEDGKIIAVGCPGELFERGVVRVYELPDRLF